MTDNQTEKQKVQEITDKDVEPYYDGCAERD